MSIEWKKISTTYNCAMYWQGNKIGNRLVVNLKTYKEFMWQPRDLLDLAEELKELAESIEDLQDDIRDT